MIRYDGLFGDGVGVEKRLLRELTEVEQVDDKATRVEWLDRVVYKFDEISILEHSLSVIIKTSENNGDDYGFRATAILNGDRYFDFGKLPGCRSVVQAYEMTVASVIAD